MKIVIDIPEKEIPAKQDIISVGIHFMDGKIVECDYPFTELEQEPKAGHWINNSPISWKCDSCGYEVARHNNTKFCPNCGAKMSESEDK